MQLILLLWQKQVVQLFVVCCQIVFLSTGLPKYLNSAIILNVMYYVHSLLLGLLQVFFYCCGANECLVSLFFMCCFCLSYFLALFIFRCHSFRLFWFCLFQFVVFMYARVEAFRSLCYGQLHLRVGVPHLLRWSLGFFRALQTYQFCCFWFC